MESGTVARVVQDFLTVSEGELSVQKGEIVQVVQRIDRIWCMCASAGRQGKVPSNVLLQMDTPSLGPGQALFVGIAHFPGQEAGDLMFGKGEMIVGTKELDSNWWQGCIDNIRTGIFPTSYAWRLDTSKFELGGNVKFYARVKTALKAQLAEELDLIPGEILLVTEQIDNDWYRGESKGRTGIFPASYVEVIDVEVAQEQAPPPSYAEISQSQWRPQPSSVDSYVSSAVHPQVVPLSRQEERWNPPVSQVPSQVPDLPPPPPQNLSFNQPVYSQVNKNPISASDMMTFSPENDKNNKTIISNFKDLSDFDFSNDDYFKQNMPSLFSAEQVNSVQPPVASQHLIDSEIEPYGITLYPFYAQFGNELSFNEGEIVKLLHHVDSDWSKGDIDGRQGIFPTSYITIVIDCEFLTSEISLEPTFQAAQNLEINSFAKVLFNFTAQMNGDISVVENELVFLISAENEDWWRVRKQSGEMGLCPGNYLTRYVAPDTTRPGPALPMRANSFSGHYEPPKVERREERATEEGRRLRHFPTLDETRWEDEEVSGILARPAVVGGRGARAGGDQRPRRPSPPSSPPPEPPSEEEAQEAQDHVPEVIRHRRSAPPVPQKPVVPPPPSKRTSPPLSLRRHGSDRTPHRPAPPVPAPGQLPVHRPLPRASQQPLPSASRAAEAVGKERAMETQAAAAQVTQISDETLKTEEEQRKKRSEQRQNVISELAFTEKEYIRDLKITYETFNLHDPRHLEARGIDAVTLFGNILEIMHVAEKLLDSIHLAMKGHEDEDQQVGHCFLSMAEELKAVYGQYCISHEDALALLEKYDGDQEVQKLFQKGLETLRQQIACFDMSSILIKPVQRIMKYPLILNELVKCTEDEHKDKSDLVQAVRTMSEVASYINECKRRKDIVNKYLEDGSSTLTTRMSKLSLHSVAKMSSRLGARLSSSLGIGTIIKDTAFEDQEQKFHTQEKTIRSFVKNVEVFLAQLEDVVMAQLKCAEAVAEFYQEAKNTANVDEFRMVQHKLVTEVTAAFKTSVDSKVLQPLQTVLELSGGPAILIQKRNNKLLDYESCLSKAEKNKDQKTQEELNLAKHNYEALNSQLLEELPLFLSLAGEIFLDSFAAFIAARKLFAARVTKHYLGLMELPLMTGCTGDVLEVFRVKHGLVCNDFGAFSFASKYFKQDPSMKRVSKGSPNLNIPSGNVTRPQSPSQKAYLQSKYPQGKLYIVRESYTSSEVMDLSVNEGVVVGVIKMQDPMGNSQRWFVDEGENQGFVACRNLEPLYGGSSSPAASPSTTRSEQATPTTSRNNPKLGSGRGKGDAPRTVVTPATPSPAPVLPPSFGPSRGVGTSTDTPPRTPAPLPPPSYEEVAGGSPSSTSSTIYEEIPSPESDQQNIYEEIPEMEFFFASYDFASLGEHMLSLKKGQVVKVLHKHDVEGNSEWWLVEDRAGQSGYVPGNYLAKYQNH